MQKDLMKKIKEIKKDDPFLITVTIFSKERIKGKELESFVFKHNFPSDEIDGTKEVINRLIGQVK